MANLTSRTIMEALWEYRDHRHNLGRAETTLRNDFSVVRRFAESVGDLQVKSVERRHVNAWLASLTRGGAGLSTIRLNVTVLRNFFKFCRSNRYMGPNVDPAPEAGDIGKMLPRERRRVPAVDFPRLLDSADTERTRIILAFGLYLFLRMGEIAVLRWKDIDLTNGEVHVTVLKTRQRDIMPIPNELDRELRSWLTHYTERHGPLDAMWFVVPRANYCGHYDHLLGRIGKLGELIYYPDREPGRFTVQVKRALDTVGFEVRDSEGSALHEGCHTLRRSGARALFDRLLDDGYDGALRTVQAMLHHKTAAMTEHYLGIDLDRKQRNDLLKGKPMFPGVMSEGNVVRLRRAEGDR